MSVPFPREKTSLAALSTVAYFIEHISQLMASLMLKPGGKDKSSISLHLPGCDLFGITPKTANVDVGVIALVYWADQSPYLNFCLNI